jgi:SAM-dependent methyltransferase
MRPDFNYSGKDNLDAMRLARRYNRFLLGLIEEQAAPGDRMLDFGAGLGLFADMLRDRGHDVSCLEVDPDLACALRARGYSCVRAPGEIEDGSIDCVYSLNVLEHIDDDRAAIAALLPKIRPGGRILAYVPAHPILFSNMDRLVGHHRRYTAATLARVLADNGLRVDRIEYVDSLGFPASLAYRLLGGDGTLNPASVATYDRWVFPASRILDRVLNRWLGKNVFAVATRP